ncbi:UDP-forming cellulose synthase catalytic subunit [Gluconobacter sp. P5B12]|uniref:UDP-forming cellulose synthase catalytic subunit n=1 Tax=unclassified Gluconobacter TaxID=2644261 RepID=UPI001C04C590|nr:UDP-forming cellulose synthase catalytic subunit [Gluconobacter sp. P5B12]
MVVSSLATWRSIRARHLVFATLGGTLLFGGAATIPLSVENQAVLAVAGIVAFFIVDRVRNDNAAIILKLLSLFVSLRYFVWRLTETVEFEDFTQAALSVALIFAEFFAGIMLVLSYFQTLHTLQRTPMALPDKVEEWPSVDVYIPTYNEDLQIVRMVVLACMGLDWPADRLNIYILDDGHRSEFFEFAQACGAGYIARPDNSHAKAGNLNHALALTSGEYIAIFDCDHIPVRAFLQSTMGWMIADRRIGLIQTPHYFYSPDPFERNLSEGLSVPPEGNLFYGLLQPGNDFWNSAFFCGSCAVLRRTALEEIGGVATDTVTEDCHTALRMQRAGWSSAYLRLPLAAGLATERLILHIGQRARWARGMTQIFRVDNPLFGPGLTFAQRLCYLSATMSFLFAIPRLIFLLAPLAYLFFGETLIAASPMALAVYVLPHFFHSVATASHVQRNWRYSFWSEVYDIALAPFIAPITFMTLLFPRRGRFNVTDKGGLVKQEYTDIRAIWPQIVILILLCIAVLSGLWRIFFRQHDVMVLNALWTTCFWAALNALLVFGAILVGRETRQIRHSPRLAAIFPLTVDLQNGSLVEGVTIDVSRGGCRLHVPPEDASMIRPDMAVRLRLQSGETGVLARIVLVEEDEVSLRWTPASPREEAVIVRFMFGRADAWLGWDNYAPDRPLRSAWLLLRCFGALFKRTDPDSYAERDKRILNAEQQAKDFAAARKKKRERIVLRPMKQGSTASLLIIGLMTSIAMSGQASAQALPSPISDAGDNIPLPDIGTTTNVPGPVMPPLAGATPQTFSLMHFGTPSVLRMLPWASIQGVNLSVPSSRLVTGARLVLSGAFSPQLAATGGAITIRLNDQYVGTITLDRSRASFDALSFDLDPVLFTKKNTLTFSLGSTSSDHETPALPQKTTDIWAEIRGMSSLTLTTVPLPPQRHLNRLPTPLLDIQASDPVVLPFVLPDNQSPGDLRGAAIMAGWFGKITDVRRISFPVSRHLPLSGNAVAIAPAGLLPVGLLLPASVKGPFVAEVANPKDSNGTVLVITGRTVEEVQEAARAVAFLPEALSENASQSVSAPETMPRNPYDAPAFIPTSRVVRFGELVSDAALTGHGYIPGTLSIPFRILPDLYTWRDKPFLAEVGINGPLEAIVDLDRSHVDVSLNNLYLRSYSWRVPTLLPLWISRYFPSVSALQQDRIKLPVWGVYAQNQLDFYFSGRPAANTQIAASGQDITISIDPDSTLDFRRAYHFAVLPNLAMFANSAFPFTRLADLSETVICLPDHPDTAVTTAFLDLMGTIGSYTWYPADKMTLIGESVLASDKTFPDQDVLVMGTLGSDRSYASLLAATPYTLENGKLHFRQRTMLDGVRYFFADLAGNAVSDTGTVKLQGALSLQSGGAFMAARSPYASHRSLVMMLSGTPQGLDELVHAMRDPEKQRGIQGDLTVVNGSHVVASRNGISYTVGSLPFWVNIERIFREHPFRIIAAAAVAIFLIGRSLHKAVMYQAMLRKRVMDEVQLSDQGVQAQ